MLIEVVLVIALLGVQSSSGPPAPDDTVKPKLTSADIFRLRTEAEGGDVQAQLALAQAYDDGDGVSQSDELAAKWYRKAAEQGNAQAQDILGNMYRIGRGVDRSKEEAVALYRRAAWKKNGNAMFNLGTAYYNGDGVGVDDATAYAWFRLAQENGSKNADDAVRKTELELPSRKINEGFRKIAGFYVNGVDLPKDYAESAKWLRRAAEGGDEDAQIMLANALINWQIPHDYSEARRWCEKAAVRHSPAGEYCLGVIYEQGIGVAKDPKEAAKWYTPAAQFGDARSMKALGRLYSTGEAGRVDRVAAYVWFVRAATQGDQDALRAAGKLQPEMDKKEVDKAELQLIQAKIDPKKVNEALASLPNK